MSKESVLLTLACVACVLTLSVAQVELPLGAYRISATMLCEGTPMKNMRVIMYDLDSGNQDDFMGEAWTNEFGQFQVTGTGMDSGHSIWASGPYVAPSYEGLLHFVTPLIDADSNRDDKSPVVQNQVTDLGTLDISSSRCRAYVEQQDVFNNCKDVCFFGCSNICTKIASEEPSFEMVVLDKDDPDSLYAVVPHGSPPIDTDYRLVTNWYHGTRRDNFFTTQDSWVYTRDFFKQGYRRSSRQQFQGALYQRSNGGVPLESWWNPDRRRQFRHV